jgi:YmgG-like glycine-zipper protein
LVGAKGKRMTKALVAPGFFGLLLGLAACTNPYDPGQRAIGGGLIGAGAGAAIGAAAGGGTGAAIGAATGGALGAITGAVTTPTPPPPPPPPYMH